MFVFMTLIVVCPFTPFYRRAALVFLTAWAIHFDENVLLTIPFLLGTLLAELSYVAKPTEHWWPIVLAIVALFFASYPPDNPEKAAWSQFLRSSAEAIIPNEHGIALSIAALILRSISLGIRVVQCHHLNHRHSIRHQTPKATLSSMRCFPRKHLLSTVSASFDDDEIGPRDNYLRHYPGIRGLGNTSNDRR
jgi:hypothetical protein